MIIELKDIPEQPIKKIDIHIEFDPSGTLSRCDSPKVTVVKEPERDVRSSQERLEHPDIPAEMINADF